MTETIADAADAGVTIAWTPAYPPHDNIRDSRVAEVTGVANRRFVLDRGLVLSGIVLCR